MKRFAVPLVIGGSLAVLLAAVMLLRAISTDSPAAPAGTPATPTREATPGPTAATPAPTPHSAPAPLPSVVRRTEDPDRPNANDAPPTLGSSSDAPPGTRANTKGLHFGLPHLREKIAANAPQVAACIGNAKPTGEATVTFIVAKKGDKLVVEQTDVDRDKTTLQDETLLECLHKTSMSIQLDGLPREADAIIVTRVMTLQDGALTDDKPLKFSYLR